MKTLQEEREAIVEEFYKKCEYERGEQSTAYTHRCANYLRTALLSHEEKVVARVKETIESYRNIASPLSEEEFDRGYVTACNDILKALTLPITDEKV